MSSNQTKQHLRHSNRRYLSFRMWKRSGPCSLRVGSSEPQMGHTFRNPVVPFFSASMVDSTCEIISDTLVSFCEMSEASIRWFLPPQSGFLERPCHRYSTPLRIPAGQGSDLAGPHLLRQHGELPGTPQILRRTPRSGTEKTSRTGQSPVE